MGDAHAPKNGAKHGMRLLSVEFTPIPTLRKAIIGILALRLVGDKGGEKLLYYWEPIIMSIKHHEMIYAWEIDILGATYHDLYTIFRLKGNYLNHPKLFMSWVYKRMIRNVLAQ